MTGDGLADVIAVARGADLAGVADVGEVVVWSGGSGLSGTPSATATLRVPGGVADDRLGHAARGVQCVDLDGDGVRDVVVASNDMTPNGRRDAGGLFLWKGGAGLAGVPAPAATLLAPSAKSDDHLPDIGNDSGMLFADVDRDGDLDVIAGTSVANRAQLDVGALYVWLGGPGLAGTVFANAVLADPAADFDERLGDVRGAGFQLVDVDDDGFLDVVVASPRADQGAIDEAGAVLVWTGRPNVSGTPPPPIVLRRDAPSAGDRLGLTVTEGVLAADVTGDGVLDLLVGALEADDAGVVDSGVIDLFVGPLAPGTEPVTLRVPGAQPGDRLGS